MSPPNVRMPFWTFLWAPDPNIQLLLWLTTFNSPKKRYELPWGTWFSSKSLLAHWKVYRSTPESENHPSAYPSCHFCLINIFTFIHSLHLCHFHPNPAPLRHSWNNSWLTGLPTSIRHSATKVISLQLACVYSYFCLNLLSSSPLFPDPAPSFLSLP